VHDYLFYKILIRILIIAVTHNYHDKYKASVDIISFEIIYMTANKKCNASLHDPLVLVVKDDWIIVFPVVKAPIRCDLLADILVTRCRLEDSTCDSLTTTSARVNFMNCLYDRINVSWTSGVFTARAFRAYRRRFSFCEFKNYSKFKK